MNKNILFFALLSFGNAVVGNENDETIYSSEAHGVLSGEQIERQFFEAVNVVMGKYLATGIVSLEFLDASQLNEKDKILHDQGADWINEKIQELPILLIFIYQATDFFPFFITKCDSVNALKHEKEFRELVEWVVKNILKIVENPNATLRTKKTFIITI